MTKDKRVAFAGASGTGKTVLAKHLEAEFELPFNPIGSRNVAKMMGYASPYDVDVAGKRGEFQRELIVQKLAWEGVAANFVTDRTPVDNLSYTILHDVRCITPEMLAQVAAGMQRYSHVVVCTMVGFFSLGGDAFAEGNSQPVRVPDRTYHEVYESVLLGIMRRYLGAGTKLLCLYEGDLEARKRQVLEFVA